MRILTRLLLIAASVQTYAAPLPENGPVSGQDEWTTPLSRFMNRDEPIAFRNVESEYDLYFPLSTRSEPVSAKLHLDFTNSNTLIEKRSQLKVALNGIVVAQMRLDPRNPHTLADIPLPVDQLRPGYNHLQFSAAQHYTEEHCEAPESPELWTELDAVKSNLTVATKPKAEAFTLSSLDSLIDSTFHEYRLDLLDLGSEPDDQMLAHGSLIAQGAALRLKHIAVELGHSPARPAPEPVATDSALHLDESRLRSDAVLMGTREQLAPFLNRSVYDRISGAYLGIYAQRNRPDRFVLVVSGLDEDQVQRAALAFALMNFPYPASTDTVIEAAHLPESLPYQGPLVLREGGTYSFKEIGFKTRTVSGLTINPLELPLTLPADLYSPGHRDAELRLHLSYGAAMRTDSVFNLKLNGNFEQAIWLKDTGGSRYRDYLLKIPLRSFRPGRNMLSIEPVLTPSVTDECTYLQTRNLIVTLFDDSNIHLPEADHYTRLPDLELFARTGFPFTRTPDGSDMAVRLTDSSPQTVLSAWQLVAKLAQISGIPLHRTQLSFARIDADRDLIVIGSRPDQAATELGPAPLGLAQPGRFPFVYRKAANSPDGPFWQRWLPVTAADAAQVDGAAWTREIATLTQTGGLGPQGLAMSYASPSHPGRTVLALIGPNPEQTYPRIHALTMPEFWSQLKGSLLVWNERPDSVAFQEMEGRFYVGKAGHRSALSYYFSDHPWQWLAAITAVLLAFAALFHHVLKRFSRRPHGAYSEELDV